VSHHGSDYNVGQGKAFADPPPGLILTTSVLALPLALAAFPQRQAVSARSLEPQFHEQGGKDGMVEFNRGI
jgi:hypothetical protein